MSNSIFKKRMFTQFPSQNLVNFIVRYLWTKDGKYAGGRWNFVFKGSILSYVVVVIYLTSLNSSPLKV